MSEEIVAVVILNWNGGDDILACLESVFRSTHTALAVVIVDNGSVDGSTQRILRRYPEVHCISNARNLGFAKGSNQGMQWALQSGIQYTLLLNGDARLHATAIGELLAAAKSEENSVVASPRMYHGAAAQGRQRLWFVYGKASLWSGIFRNPAFDQEDTARWSEPMDMEYASGCCMLIPTAIVQNTGMFDEAFFAYCEDIDLSLRIRAAGYRLRYVPSAHLWHGSAEPKSRKRSVMYRYLSTRNNLWVVRKHGSWLEILTCLCILPSRSFFRVVRMMARAEWYAIAAEVRGVKDGAFAPIRACRLSGQGQPGIACASNVASTVSPEEGVLAQK